MRAVYLLRVSLVLLKSGKDDAGPGSWSDR